MIITSIKRHAVYHARCPVAPETQSPILPAAGHWIAPSSAADGWVIGHRPRRLAAIPRVILTAMGMDPMIARTP
jgi:hypothetical protein